MTQLIAYIRTGANDIEIYQKFGGIKIYIPRKHPAIKELIRAEFNGRNYRRIAFKYRVTENFVRKVINEKKRKVL